MRPQFASPLVTACFGLLQLMLISGLGALIGILVWLLVTGQSLQAATIIAIPGLDPTGQDVHLWLPVAITLGLGGLSGWVLRSKWRTVHAK